MKGGIIISSGIYKITNLKNKMVYIGESFDINARWDQHKNDLLSNSHTNIFLQKDFNQYGKKYFKFEILQEYKTDKPLVTQSHLIILEDAWIKIYKSKNISLYNMENTLEEVISGNKLLQLAPNIATNILIGQLIKFIPVFNEQISIFEFKERNSIKENIKMFFVNKGREISQRELNRITRYFNCYIKENNLENKIYQIDYYNNKMLGIVEVKSVTKECQEYIFKYLEEHERAS